jgi:NTP pyrophosphatase (non-canonical NTP hydrolase)
MSESKKIRKCDCYNHPHQVCDICQGPSGEDREPLTFRRFHETNVARSHNDVKHSNDWTPLAWGGALAGEVGELCNYLKKVSRGDKIEKQVLAHEIADIITYISLISDKLDIDMEEAVIEKFNIVSDRWKSKHRL